jgi:hypothetical protein
MTSLSCSHTRNTFNASRSFEKEFDVVVTDQIVGHFLVYGNDAIWGSQTRDSPSCPWLAGCPGPTQRPGQRAEIDVCPACRFAPRVGLEPTTNGLTVLRQQGYGQGVHGNPWSLFHGCCTGFPRFRCCMHAQGRSARTGYGSSARNPADPVNDRAVQAPLQDAH